MQRRRSLSILRLDVGAQLHQRLDRLHVAVTRRLMQRRPSLSSLRLDVRAQLHQRLDRLHVAVGRRRMQRRRPTYTLLVHVHACGHQPPHLRHVAVGRRLVQAMHAHAASVSTTQRLLTLLQPTLHANPTSESAPQYMGELAVKRFQHALT